MTERQKVADLPQDEKEQLLKRAADAGIKNAMIATWYVDTLEAKIAAKKSEKNAEQSGDGQKSDDTSSGTDEDQQNKQQDDESETPVDDEQKTDETPADPGTEADELNKDVEPPAPVISTPEACQSKVTKESKLQKITICHICRAKVINGKCSGCGFDISKR